MQLNYNVFKNIPLFNGITENELTKMLECLGAIVKEFDKNQIIFWEGEPSEYIGIVLTGKVLIMKEDFDGNRSILSSADSTELFGESYACAEVGSLPVSIVASEKSKVMLIKCSKIQSPCAKSCSYHNRMIHNLLYIVAQNNISLNHKIEFTSKRTTKDKIMSYLYYMAKRAGNNSFTIPYNRQELADYLCVERSAMSAQIGKLRDEGIIEVNRSHFKILT